jgi:UDP-N-acetylmuramyl pentapeptide phosphotransferase/UDP-N-acetylglucosamine-1-phosphate transferase
VGKETNGSKQMKVSDWITIICCISLSIVLMSTVAVVLIGLFDDRVDNAEVFKLINPAFNMVVGAFVGTIAGIKMGRDDVNK